MKKANVKIGQTYLCKVGRNLTEVRIDSESPHGGWNATNVKTGRSVRIKSAQRLRAPARQVAPEAKKSAKATMATNAAKERATRAKDTPQAKKPKNTSPPHAKRMSLMEAAIQILRETGRPMNTKAILEAVLAKGLWGSKGQTPAATLYASILREIQKKGDQARFVKTDRGKFALKP